MDKKFIINRVDLGQPDADHRGPDEPVAHQIHALAEYAAHHGRQAAE